MLLVFKDIICQSEFYQQEPLVVYPITLMIAKYFPAPHQRPDSLIIVRLFFNTTYCQPN